jgi:tetratricopeptide (TPR) repeat protein
VEPAFRASFETDYGRMETELRSYVSRQAYPGLAYQLKQASAAAEVTLRRMPAAETLFHLGSLLLKTDRAAEAEALFTKALAADPAAAEPHEGLGFVALERKQPAAALEHLRQAVERKSTNYLVHYLYAETLWRGVEGGAPPSDVAQRIADAARGAMALRPTFLPAHHLAGAMYLAGRLDAAEGIRVVGETHTRFPRDTRAAINLAALHANRGDYAAAKSALESTLARLGSGEGADARRMLDQIDARVAAAARRRETAAAPANPGSARPVAAAPAPAAPLSGSPAATPRPPAPAPRPAASDPAIDFQSEMTGVLAAIECKGRSRVLVVSVGGKPVRFSIAPKLRVFSRPNAPDVAFECGPLNAPATVYFNGGADPVLQGEAVAIMLGASREQ